MEKTVQSSNTQYDAVIFHSNANFIGNGLSYTPYILFAALQHEYGYGNVLLTNKVPTKTVDVPESRCYYVFYGGELQEGVTTYLVEVVLPPMGVSIRVFGYPPLIEAKEWPLYTLSPELLAKGMSFLQQEYVCAHGEALEAQCDCDGHIKALADDENAVLYPFYTSFGCPAPCTYCPVPVWCNRKVTYVPLENVKANVEYYFRNSLTDLHFIDEDFLLNSERASQVSELFMARKKPDGTPAFNIILQASVQSVLRFVKDFGVAQLEEMGVRVVEIGLESVSLNEYIGKFGIHNYVEVDKIFRNNPHISTFFLNMTFFPGETLTTLNKLGAFLRAYGSDPETLCSRVKTNGTEGGLGQFYVPYKGTKMEAEAEEKGSRYTDNPIRLFPSYIPHSFMKSVVTEVNLEPYGLPINTEWFEHYSLECMLHMRILEHCMECTGMTVRKMACEICNIFEVPKLHCLMFIAICARLHIIKGED